MSEQTRHDLIVNGSGVTLNADPQAPLLVLLRNDLGLTGARSGCAIGECGACTVLVDGEPVRSCSTPIESVRDREVTTPEGLGTPEAPHPVQQAFLDVEAGQCAYCINGMIMSVAALQRRGACTRDELVTTLDEHVCRCGTHSRILQAASAALGLSLQPREVTCARVEPADAGLEGAATAAPPSPSLEHHPRVEQWLALRADGRVDVRTGKVEIGQGIRTALAQIVAAHLGVSVDRLVVGSAGTEDSPDEGYTAGSNSLDQGGAALAAAATAMRRLLLERLADRSGAPASALSTTDAGVVDDAGVLLLTWETLALEEPVSGRVSSADVPDWARGPIGRSEPREDLRAKVTGAPAFVHDLARPGMVHARAVLPPTYDAAPVDVPHDEVEDMPGVVALVRDDRLLLVVAEREEQAVRAHARLARGTSWDDPGLAMGGQPPESFRSLPGEPYVVRDREGEAATDAGDRRATYRLPYQAHASVAPSCAVAEVDGGDVVVWSHTQGVHPLRRELATILRMPQDRLYVRHLDGPGCYGRNLADDAAAFAAVAARAVGRPARFQFTVDDEFSWEPYGPAALVDVGATVRDGRVDSWNHQARTDVHSVRPTGSGDALAAAWLGGEGVRPQWRGPAESGARNAVPPYAFRAMAAMADHVRGPLRTGPLRSLGSYANVFAAESFVDELAAWLGIDPLAFRLRHLEDGRVRRVLRTAAEGIGWQERTSPSGRGVGIAVARYKEVKALVAQAVRASIDTTTGEIAVHHVVTVCDAGTVINPDGLANQLEGGTLQGLSRALHEQVRAGDDGVRTRDWTTYPVLRFRDVPTLETILLDAAGTPPLGAGEAAVPPVAPALANAIDDAVGIRLRDLPLTPKAVQRRVYELTDEEAERVRLD